MNAGTLQVVATHEGVPADAVVWTERGIVTADSQGVMRWQGNDPGPVTPVDEGAFGRSRWLSDLGGGEIGVAAARVRPDGTVGPEGAALDAAIARALAATPTAYYRIRTAGWAAGGKRLWLSVERKSPRRDRAPLVGDEPLTRSLVLDDTLALVGEVADDPGWRDITTAGEYVATAGMISLWPAGDPTRRLARLPGPPGGMGLSGGGTLLAYTDVGGVTVVRTTDGSTVARWDLGGADTVAMSRDGTRVAVATGDHLQLWQLQGDAAHKLAEATLPQLTLALAFAPDGNGIVVGGMARTVSVLAIR